jgi:hypothetical protein
VASYSLPVFTSPVGTFQVTIVTNMTGLTAPTSNTILEIGRKQEILTEEAGTLELSTLDLKVKDDTTTYSAGFWYNVLTSSTSLHILVELYEGGGYKTFFNGVLSGQEIIWTELYVGSSRVRVGQLTLDSVISKMFQINMATFINDCYDYAGTAGMDTGFNTVGVTGLFRRCLPIDSMIGVALKTCGLNSSVQNGTWVFDASYPDVKFINSTPTEYTVDKIWIPLSYWWNDQVWKYNYWDTTNGGSLENLYGGDFRSFLGDLLFNFGLILKVEWSGSYFGATLIQRYGHAYSTKCDFGSREISSEIIQSSPAYAKSTKVQDRTDNTKLYWYHKERKPGGSSSTPDTDLDFDLERNLCWNSPIINVGLPYSTKVFGVGNSISGITQVVDYKYYDYVAGQLVSVNGTTQDIRLQHALAAMTYKCLLLKDRMFTRRYRGITTSVSSTESFQNVGLLRRVDINDGVSSATYYANRVTVEPQNGTCEIDWVKEVIPQ